METKVIVEFYGKAYLKTNFDRGQNLINLSDANKKQQKKHFDINQVDWLVSKSTGPKKSILESESLRSKDGQMFNLQK